MPQPVTYGQVLSSVIILILRLMTNGGVQQPLSSLIFKVQIISNLYHLCVLPTKST